MKNKVLQLTLLLSTIFGPPTTIITQPASLLPMVLAPPTKSQDPYNGDSSSEDEENMIDHGQKSTPEEETQQEKI